MTDNIRPDHYRTGEIDLYEAWYQTYPFEQYRAIMQAIAERYMRRDKKDRVEDLGKAIYTLERLKEKEIEHDKKNTRTLEEVLGEITKTAIVGKYFDEIYFNREDLLKRLWKEGYRYLARDEDNVLYAYEGTPLKVEDLYCWEAQHVFNYEYIGNDNFPEIKWTDDEPTKIAELLATYENGGENGK